MSNIPKTSLHKNIDMTRLFDLVNTIEDPRTKRGHHPFESIVIIGLCAKIGGANDAVAIEHFGKNHVSWFKEFLPLPYGIPSHDTFNRIFGKIPTREMQKLLLLIQPIMEPSESMENENKVPDEVQNAVKKPNCY